MNDEIKKDETKKVNDEDLNVSGGLDWPWSKNEGKKPSSDLSGLYDKYYRDDKCKECGCPIKKHVGPMGLHGSEMGRYTYYNERCHDCALKKPYWGDKVVDGEIVRRGALLSPDKLKR